MASQLLGGCYYRSARISLVAGFWFFSGSYFNSREHGYCVPFLGSDASVVARTQRQLADKHRMDPVMCLHNIVRKGRSQCQKIIH